jgi:hypothetical protein
MFSGFLHFVQIPICTLVLFVVLSFALNPTIFVSVN